MRRRPVVISIFTYGHRSRKRRKGIVLAVLLLLVCLAAVSFLSKENFREAVPVFAAAEEGQGQFLNLLKRLGFVRHTPDIIDQIIPFGAFAADRSHDTEELLTFDGVINKWVQFITRMEPGSIQSILDSQLVGLAEAANFEKEAQTLPPLPPREELPTAAQARDLPRDKVLVGIYTSHNAETYKPTDGVERLPGENGGVSKVAKVLSETLEKEYGIATAFSDTIHDYPRWGASYGNSEKTAKKMLQKYPSIEVLIDVHRDAGIGKRKTTVIQGKRAARILVIVGTDKRWEHPNWRENLAFANRLAAAMEKLYPGLADGVRAQSGRYNQHLHSHAILVEIGSVENSLEEAQTSARLFARVLAEVLNQE